MLFFALICKYTDICAMFTGAFTPGRYPSFHNPKLYTVQSSTFSRNKSRAQKNPNPCHQMPLLAFKYAKINDFVAGALTGPCCGRLKCFQSPSWIRGQGKGWHGMRGNGIRQTERDSGSGTAAEELIVYVYDCSMLLVVFCTQCTTTLFNNSSSNSNNNYGTCCVLSQTDGSLLMYVAWLVIMSVCIISSKFLVIFL